MHDDAERDMAADSQAERENDPFSHHHNDRPCVRGVRGKASMESSLEDDALYRWRLG
jgi:hypothetical protein